jgi:hypothetical protein
MSSPTQYIGKQRVGARNLELPFGLEIRRGNIQDAFAVQKFGENATVTSKAMVWSDEGVYTWMTSAQQVKAVSGDAKDDGTPSQAGVGAHNIRIQGLDANWDRQEELLALNGQAAVTSVNSYIRVFRAAVESVGSEGDNAGIIDVYDNGGANEIASIPAGYNQTMQAVYTIPAGYTGYLTRYYASSSANQTVDVYLQVRGQFNGSSNYVDQVKNKILIFRGYTESNLHTPIVVAEKSDVYLSAAASGAAGVAGGFDLWCIK